MPPRSQVQLPTANLFTGRRGVREGHLSHEQLGALFRAARSAEERALFRLLYAYGLRVSEAGAMPLSAVHPSTIDIVRLKRSRSGVYPLLPEVAVVLRRWQTERPESPWLFPHHLDPTAPLDKWSVGRLFKRAAARAGLPSDLRHAHVLKHTIATHLLAQGWDVRRVQEWIGHADIRSTSIYAEVGSDLKEQGAQDVSSFLKVHR